MGLKVRQTEKLMSIFRFAAVRYCEFFLLFFCVFCYLQTLMNVQAILVTRRQRIVITHREPTNVNVRRVLYAPKLATVKRRQRIPKLRKRRSHQQNKVRRRRQRGKISFTMIFYPGRLLSGKRISGSSCTGTRLWLLYCLSCINIGVSTSWLFCVRSTLWLLVTFMRIIGKKFSTLKE